MGARKFCVVCSKVYRLEDVAVCPDDGTPLVIEAGSDVELGDRSSSRLGHVLGNYRLQRVLGEGAAGTIYAAEHVRLGRCMAIKLLHENVANPTMVARFFNEARAVNEIRHSNIIDIEDFVTTDSGEHYLVMELLEGADLRTVLHREGKLDPERVTRIGEQVASALAAVHGVNIAHRDLKPDNIFICRRGDEEVAKLLDFGVAKFTDQQGVTRAGTTMGTPQYMAPEMIISGRESEVGPGCDIYALGMVMYECLTGAPAFNSSQIASILRAHCYEAVEPPSNRRGEPVPRVLEAAVMKCLEKVRAERFSDASELCTALRSQLPVRVSGQMLDPRARTRATQRRRRTVMMLPAFAMVAAAVLLQLVPGTSENANANVPAPARPAIERAPPPAAAVDQSAAKAAMMSVTLSSKPAGAKLFLGNERQPLGTAPATLIIPMSSNMVRLIARFPDNTETVQTVVFDREIPEVVFEKTQAAVPKRKPDSTPRPTPRPGSKVDDRDSTLDPFKR